MTQPTTIVGAQVFDGMRLLGPRTVVIAEGRIVSVDEPAPLAPGGHIIDAHGRALLPGFIDAHVHIGFFEPSQVLRGGVTTARDLGWPQRKIFEMRDDLRATPTAGPLLLAAGGIITASGGYPTRASWAPDGTSLEVSDEDEGRNAVARMVAAGADIIKIAQAPDRGPVMPAKVLTAVVNEAHAAGLKVTSHLTSIDELTVALDASIDELAHGLWADSPIPDELIARMAGGMVVVPTLHIDPSSERVENLRRFVAVGGRVIYGTDMGNAGPPPGIDVEELELMVSAGMTRLETLQAATSLAADHLGLDERGRIEGGAMADMILVDGDPTVDLGVLSKPSLVMREGEVVLG